MLKTQFTYSEEGQLEKDQRALPADEQNPQVVYLGMLGYKIMAVADTLEEAEEYLLTLKVACRSNAKLGLYDKGRFTLPGWTKDPSEHDFDIRTQAQLDALVEAIKSTRESTRGHR